MCIYLTAAFSYIHFLTRFASLHFLNALLVLFSSAHATKYPTCNFICCTRTMEYQFCPCNNTKVQTLGVYYIYRRQTRAHAQQVDTPRSLVHVLYSGVQNGRPIVAIQCRKHCNGAVSETSTQLFWPLLPIEYVIWFSGRKDSLEVRCWADTQTHRQTQLP